ncbi:thiosulfate:glutathione sulfurtransferase [Callorhinchus milii]|uniref:Thiosulfate sulfurtransferase/rhodanese-like domain-containing protein 1 n=3 Tax=Callorhinchus milii TaxID=7868 RepID=A0A4W3K0E0_CALMI|nr:thiosulfate:glutathione sulfurtransferase [Callorhinchus milii]|eukprot:gi/632966082/ref/XP_007899222.1/ PREDICTED: thiosulfate sulfurtransferase/rhodanese-like domain-containing protein 1 [Callorhinchus milii]
MGNLEQAVTEVLSISELHLPSSTLATVAWGVLSVLLRSSLYAGRTTAIYSLQRDQQRFRMSGTEEGISKDELLKMMAKGPAHIFDVRTPAEVAEKGKIEGSINIPVDEVLDALNLDPEAFRKKYNAEKPKPEAENLVFHCQKGMRGNKATQTAISLGYTRARNLIGGYGDWASK